MIKLFKNFEPELIKAWEELYKKGANYNLSPQWCIAWYEQFGRPENIRIITLWKNNELRLLAPLYLRKNKLALIGTKPDLYDEFNVLYEKTDDVVELLNYIITNNYQVDFRHLSAESEFSKALIKYFSGNGVNQHSHVDETKPYITGEFKPQGAFRTDVNRCKRNIAKHTEKEYAFELFAQKSDKNIDDFIKLHTTRWNGGMLSKNLNTINFLKNIIKNNENTVLSMLYIKNTNETAAICIGFLDSNKKYWYSMTAYDYAFSRFSPGKVLLYELITSLSEYGVDSVDLGRGSEAYKSWLTDKQEVLFTIKTFKNKKLYKVKNLVDKILELISSC